MAAFVFLLSSSLEHSLIINAGVHPISTYLPSIPYEPALPRHSDSCWGYGNEEWALCLMEGLACGQMTP